MRVFGRSGLRNAYRSVLSAVGSSEISGASRWLDALPEPGPRRATKSAASTAPTTASRMNAQGLRIRCGSFLTAGRFGMTVGRGRRTPLIRREGPDRFGLSLSTVRRARLAILGVVCLLGAASPAAGHDPQGRAQPSVATAVKGSGLTRVVGFRVRDVDSGDPDYARRRSRCVPATITARSSTRPSPASSRSSSVRCSTSPALGRWHVGVRIGGTAVVPTSFSFDVEAVGRPSVDGSSGGSGDALWIGAATAAVVGAAGALAAVLVFRRRRRL